MLTIGSLFSGIGGLELGLERAGLGPTIWQVESDPYCREVLARHWPDARRFDDVRTVGAELPAVDIICGGFPCQDLSSAGSRVGLAGARSGLWSEFARVVAVVRPTMVIVENVASGASLWVDSVVCRLGGIGYASLPIPLSACAVGAPHRRDRIFIVARHTDRDGQPARAVHTEVEGAPCVAADVASHDGEQRRTQREQCEAWRWGEPYRNHWGIDGVAEPYMVRVVHGVPRRLDSPSRRIKALGNSVVPQCAEVVGWVVRELMARRQADGGGGVGGVSEKKPNPWATPSKAQWHGMQSAPKDGTVILVKLYKDDPLRVRWLEGKWWAVGGKNTPIGVVKFVPRGWRPEVTR